MFKGEKSQQGERLGAMVSFVPLEDPRKEAEKTQFYSFGSEAHKSFMPNPAHGKGILPIPGAPANSFNNSTNWFLFLKSLYDLGMPHGLVTNTVAPLEGTWVYIQHIDEPAERATFQSNTAEVSAAPRTPKKIAVVGEIIQGGKPWEGGGGWPDKPVQAAPVNGSPSPMAPPVAAPAPPPPPAGNQGDVRTIGMASIGDLLEAALKGGQKQVPRLGLRNNTFSAVHSKYGESVAAAVLAQVFDTAGALEAVVGDLGCTIQGGMIVIA
jgi:hypothetical protein